MKQLLILLILFLISEAAYAQDLDKIKSQDILILYFDYPKNKRVRGEGNEVINIYYSYPLLSGKNKIETLKVGYRTYMTYRRQSIGEKAFQIKVNKSFLRNNKDIIVTREFMEKLGYKQADLLLRSAKRILLIDSADTKSKKSILLKQVIFIGNAII